MKKPKAKAKRPKKKWVHPLDRPKPLPKLVNVVTREYFEKVFHTEFQPVQQELAAVVQELRRADLYSQNYGKSLARIESDLNELIKHLMPDIPSSSLLARRVAKLEPKPKTQKIET